MTEHELREFSRDCYAALGGSMPAPGSPAWRIWAEMCANVPLNSAPWIRAEFVKLESMPRNFGNAVLRFYREWRTHTGYSDAQKSLCPNCDRETPGFYTAFRRDNGGRPHSFLVVCPCNSDPAWKDLESYPKAEAERRGHAVKRHGESLAGLEAALLAEFRGRPFGDGAGNPAFDRLARAMPGINQRRRHLEYTAEAESWEPF